MRADGSVRWLEHLDGPPAEVGPPTACERFGEFLDVLYERLPCWDNALILALLLVVLPFLLVVFDIPG